MIKKNRFYTKEVLDEPIYFEFTDGIKKAMYISDNTPITLRKEAKELEKLLRIERLKNCNRKKAFSTEEHNKLLQDRECGLSIRQLAMKYNKSTRTIQKYLKVNPAEPNLEP